MRFATLWALNAIDLANYPKTVFVFVDFNKVAPTFGIVVRKWRVVSLTILVLIVMLPELIREGG
jgi:hypothetical protein